jgi:hypothetical protein
MRNACDGPMAALVALLWNHGVLTNSVVTLADLHPVYSIVHTRENPISRLAAPDPPPPRA